MDSLSDASFSGIISENEAKYPVDEQSFRSLEVGLAVDGATVSGLLSGGARHGAYSVSCGSSGCGYICFLFVAAIQIFRIVLGNG